MCNDLIGNMLADGFTIEAMGGNCRAMAKRIGNRMIIATAMDEPDYPHEDWFMVSVYEGDWLENPDVPELASFGSDFPFTTEYAPIDEALRLADVVARGGFLVSVESLTMGTVLSREPSLERILERFFGDAAEPYFFDSDGEEPASANDVAARLFSFDPLQIFDEDGCSITLQRDSGKA